MVTIYNVLNKKLYSVSATADIEQEVWSGRYGDPAYLVALRGDEVLASGIWVRQTQLDAARAATRASN